MIGQKLKTFTFLRKLGQGSFATVYQASDQRDRSVVAIKVVARKLIRETPKLQELVKTEIRVLRQCKNQNVIKFVDSFHSDHYIFIATEYCNGGDMDQYLETKKRLTEDQAVEFLKQIINGFKGLHQVGAMHRDFKLANILLHNGICKIADLGFAKQMEKKAIAVTVLGTSLTMAPQVLKEKPYGIQADIWSIGVVYYQLLYGDYPYNGTNDFDILKKIQNNRPNFSGVQISEDSKDFIDRCLTVEPAKRISWTQIYEHRLLLNKKAGFIFNTRQSKINMTVNKNLYQKGDIKIQKDFIYPELNIDYNKKLDVQWEDAGQIKKSVNVQKLMKENQDKKKIQKAIIEYQKLYLAKRNNIMFLFKFIIPYIDKLLSIKANHSLSIFICTKNAFLEIKQLNKAMGQRQNIFKLQECWKQFVESSAYQQIKSQIENDKEIIFMQVMCYQMDIDATFYNPEIQAQLSDIENTCSKNWLQLLNGLLKDYWFLLAQHIPQKKNEDKICLIRILQALSFVQDNSKVSAEQFANYMQKIQWDNAEKKILLKYYNVFK